MAIQLNPGTRRLLQLKLREAFPDAHVEPGDVDALALALHQGKAAPGGKDTLPPELRDLDFSECAAQLDELAQVQSRALGDGGDIQHLTRLAGDRVRYYWVEATHAREHPHGYEPFVGKLAMLRVSLPPREPRDFPTAIGSFELEDHLIATVQEANDKFQGALGYPLQRVDVITPPRQGLRFGAISVILGYREPDKDPSCYILEAGTATGQAKVLFLGKTLSTKINQFSGYQPTPFTCSDNAYTGMLTLNGDSPGDLHITARKILGGKSQPAYMDLRAHFIEQTSTIRNIWAGLLIARAAVIVLSRKASGLPDGCEKKELPE
jgi:hypothetical protein